MRRELVIIRSLNRLAELLGEPTPGPGGVLGVGVFSAIPTRDTAGISLRVSPRALRQQLLRTIGDGFLSPLSSEIVFLGDADAGLIGGQPSASLPSSRWLLLGLHAAGFGSSEFLSSYEKTFPDFRSAQSVGDLVALFLRAVHGRIMDLRPDRVFLIPDLILMEGFVSNVLHAKGQPVPPALQVRQELLEAVLSWCVEDLLHPRTVVCFEREGDFRTACSLLRPMLRSTSSNADLALRL